MNHSRLDEPLPLNAMNMYQQQQTQQPFQLFSAPPFHQASGGYPPHPERSSASTQESFHPAPPRRFVIEHSYHDRSGEDGTKKQHKRTSDSKTLSHQSRNGRHCPESSFPAKLHKILDQIEEDGLGHILSWQPHGRCFVIRKIHEFRSQILFRYFKLTKQSSWQRQLSLYGFKRITQGKDRNGYYHEYFLRGKLSLVSNIHRVRVKGTGVRGRADPQNEPRFWDMPFIQVSTAKAGDDEKEAISDSDSPVSTSETEASHQVADSKASTTTKQHVIFEDEEQQGLEQHKDRKKKSKNEEFNASDKKVPHLVSPSFPPPLKSLPPPPLSTKSLSLSPFPKSLTALAFPAPPVARARRQVTLDSSSHSRASSMQVQLESSSAIQNTMWEEVGPTPNEPQQQHKEDEDELFSDELLGSVRNHQDEDELFSDELLSSVLDCWGMAPQEPIPL